MDWRAARATAAITVATLVVSGLLIVTNLVPVAALGGGFIPAMWGAAIAPPANYILWVPTALRPLTATLVHGGWAHLTLNLFMFFYVGQQVERALGWGGIAILYLVGAYAAAVGQWAPDPASAVPMIGASGAISAVVAAYAVLYGERRARKWGPFSADLVHIVWLAAAWIGIQLLVGIAGLGGLTIAIGAHIGGFVAGLLLARPLLLWRYRRA